jgi:purine-binding chemotaxis protein CheW
MTEQTQQNQTTASENSTTTNDQRAGMYLTFCLDGEEYGLEILKVREIIGMMSITAVPRTPDFIKGVINLRGKVIPVIDLRLKFNLVEAEHTDETCIIVVDVGQTEVGLVVDRVSEVRDIAGSEIDDPPTFGTAVDSSFLLGMGKSENKVTMLLHIENVLGGDGETLASLADVA